MYFVFYAVISLSLLLIYITRRRYNYWKRRNVKYMKPTFLLGNYGPLLLQKKNIGETVQELCQKMNEPMFGAFYGTEPVLVVQDPELVKLVLTKDFHHYSGREISSHIHKEPATNNLFFFYGDKWKVLRQNLSPIFSTSKMKQMFPLIEKCARTFECLLYDELKVSNVTEIRALMARYTTDCIASCVFGIESDTMGTSLEKNPFKLVADMVSYSSIFKGVIINFRVMWPSIFYALKLELFPSSMMNIFTQISKRVCKERGFKKSSRNDFVDLLIDISSKGFLAGDCFTDSSKGKINIEIDEDTIAANCFLYFAAGFETSSTISAFTLYEIAKHPEVQERAIAEVDAYLKSSPGGVIGYDCVTELPYLDRCVQEALRLYPVLPVLTREVTEPVELQGLRLEKGARVHVPLYHLQRHPKYWRDPDEFEPDRFLSDQIVPYTYFPFGEGPRICIGMRFAKMQMMAGLVALLKNFRVEPAPGAPRRLRLDSNSMITQCKDPIRLTLIPRNAWGRFEKTD